jgi:DinB family protein
MKRVFAVAVVPLFTFLFLLFGGSGTLRAQNANPVSTHLKGQWTNIRDLLTKEADRMPEENYRFKPAPEMEDFGQRMAHVITFSMRGCAAVKGEQKQLKFGTPPSKAEVTAAMKEVNDECDGVFNSLSDADLGKMVNVGQRQRPVIALLEGLVLEHSQEVYGYTAVYLRLKGIVPPSSVQNER